MTALANATKAKQVAAFLFGNLEFTSALFASDTARFDMASTASLVWSEVGTSGKTAEALAYASYRLGYGIFEDWSQTWDPINYPSSFTHLTQNESHHAAEVLFQATHDRGGLWSGNSTYRTAALAMFDSTQKAALKGILEHWGYTVTSDLVATW